MRRKHLPMDLYSVNERKLRAKAQAAAEEAERLEEIEFLRQQREREATWNLRTCGVPVEPGYGQAAFKAGCEDEWIDRMTSKYGGEW